MTITQTNSVSGSLIATASGRLNVTVTPILSSLASASAPATFFDSDVFESYSSETWNEYRITAQLGSSYTLQNISACQSITDGVVAPVGLGGFGRFRVRDGAISRIFKCDTTKRSGQTFRAFVEYTAGSIARYLYDQVATLFDTTPDVNYFSTYNHATSTYTRNAACWGASIDLSCVAVASNDGGGWTRQRGGTLITPRHVLIAWHFPYGIGTQLRFVNAAGTVETRTVVGTSYASRAFDFLVCTLDAAVTVVSSCQIAGMWIQQGQETDSYAVRWYSGGLVIHSDQNARLYAATLGREAQKTTTRKVTLQVNGDLWNDFPEGAYFNHERAAIQSEFDLMRKTPVPGDSGQPVFVVIAELPVLVCCWQGPDAGPPAYFENGAVLNALITVSDDNAGISTGLTVTVAPDPTL